MKSTQYAALDAAILSAITTHGGAGFYKMLAGRAGREAVNLETHGREPFRILDARLQALRKAGQIKSAWKAGFGVVWVLAEGGAA